MQHTVANIQKLIGTMI